jgi:hypothetical protein
VEEAWFDGSGLGAGRSAGTTVPSAGVDCGGSTPDRSARLPIVRRGGAAQAPSVYLTLTGSWGFFASAAPPLVYQ